MNLEIEISPKLAEQYADMLSLDFRRRSSLLNSWSHYTNDLVLWDKRLQTYLEGLKYLRQNARKYLDGWTDSLLTRGDVFALGTFAFHTEDAQLLENSLSLMLAVPHLAGVVKSVIAWAPSTSMLWERAFLSPTIRVMATCIRHDLPKAPELTANEISLLMSSPAAIPGLIRALHHQQHPDYQSIILPLTEAKDPQIRLEALTTVLTHHLPCRDLAPEKQLIGLLAAISKDTLRHQIMQLYLCNTHASPEHLLTWIEENEPDKRLYLTALGYSGRPANIDILKEFLDKPEYARLAAAAIVMITGAGPESAGWQRESAPPDIAPPDSDPDSAQSWPDKSAFERWWKSHSSQLNTSEVYVAGLPATKEGLQHVLQHGCLALHPLAKSRLCHLTRRPLNEYFAPTFTGIHQYAR